jgi:hypothetical protein
LILGIHACKDRFDLWHIRPEVVHFVEAQKEGGGTASDRDNCHGTLKYAQYKPPRRPVL